MERSFDHDFSGVRVHLNARMPHAEADAFTTGTDVHLAGGRLDADSASGRHLLAHELAHVVQQERGRVRPTGSAGDMGVNATPALEREADRLGGLAARGLPAASVVGRGTVAPDPARRVSQAGKSGERHKNHRRGGRGKAPKKTKAKRNWKSRGRNARADVAATDPGHTSKKGARTERGDKIHTDRHRKKARRPRARAIRKGEAVEHLDRRRERAKARAEWVKSAKEANRRALTAGKAHVYGHQAVEGQEDHASAKAIRHSIAQLQAGRAAHRRSVAAHVYKERARFGPTANKKVLRKATDPSDETKTGSGFLNDLFGDTGSYVDDLGSRQVDAAAVLKGARSRKGGKRIHYKIDTANHQTHFYDGDSHVYTLHHGASAWYHKRDAESGREILGQHGSDDEFVRDDRGVPTRRFAYGVKDSDQVGVLEKSGSLGGRFMLKGHSILGDSKRTILNSTPGERAQYGDRPRTDAIGHHDEDRMLYTHQEYGSSARQRGVSISESPTALLSNEARGFARHDDPGARKLQIDLSKVPTGAPTTGPNLVNFHQQIPGYEAQRVFAMATHSTSTAEGGRTKPTGLQYSQKKNQARWDWSVAKNREMFLRELHPSYLTDKHEVSPLENMHYYRPPSGDTPATIHTDIKKELHRIESSALASEHEHLKAEAKSRATRSAPSRVRKKKGPRGARSGEGRVSHNQGGW